MRIVNLNLRYAHNAEMNNQGIREPRIVDFIKTYKPDLLGVQECEKFWRDRLADTIGKLGYIPAQEEAYSESGAYAFKNFIWYDPSLSELTESGRIWLSEAPEKPSKGFGSRFYISAGFAVIKSKETGESVGFVNTHLNVDSAEIRGKEAELLRAKIRELSEKGYTVFVTGDFNDNMSSQLYTDMTAELLDARYTAEISTDMYGFNGYSTEGADIPTSRYKCGDFCFHTKDDAVRIDKFDVVDKWCDGYMSDHNAIVVDFTFNKEVAK